MRWCLLQLDHDQGFELYPRAISITCWVFLAPLNFLHFSSLSWTRPILQSEYKIAKEFDGLFNLHMPQLMGNCKCSTQAIILHHYAAVFWAHCTLFIKTANKLRCTFKVLPISASPRASQPPLESLGFLQMFSLETI